MLACILQNKILHTRLEALHIQLAEKDRNYVGVSSGSTVPDSEGDSAMQNVINYLRRSKEIVSDLITNTFSSLKECYSNFFFFILTGRNRNFFVKAGKTSIAITSKLTFSYNVNDYLCIMSSGIYWVLVHQIYLSNIYCLDPKVQQLTVVSLLWRGRDSNTQLRLNFTNICWFSDPILVKNRGKALSPVFP